MKTYKDIATNKENLGVLGNAVSHGANANTKMTSVFFNKLFEYAEENKLEKISAEELLEFAKKIALEILKDECKDDKVALAANESEFTSIACKTIVLNDDESKDATFLKKLSAHIYNIMKLVKEEKDNG